MKKTPDFSRILILFTLLNVVLSEDAVPEYKDSDFDSKMAEHETALVMFYAPWCGHCKKLKPEYEKAYKELKRSDPPSMLIKVDCTEGGKETCRKHSVGGYPTLKVFRHGKFIKEFDGTRDAAGIIKFMNSQAGPSAILLKTKEELENFVKNPFQVVVVGAFQKRSKLKKVFLELAENLRDKVKFGYCEDKSVLDEAGLEYGITLHRPTNLQSKFEESKFSFLGEEADYEKLENFIKDNFHGLVGYRTTLNKDDFKTPLVVAYYHVDYEKNVKGTNYWRNRILKVAVTYRDQLNFAISSSEDFESELEEFGFEGELGEKQKKPVVAAKDSNNDKYRMEDEFSVENFTKFVEDLLLKKIDPYMKSEPVPKDNNGPVKIAVARNFNELVLKNDKDVFIEFYAPWCGQCKKLAPIYEELGEKVGKEVEIIKMDATANDVPDEFKTDEFPTLYWIPKDDKDKPVKYTGKNDLKNLLAFVAGHATEELSGFDRQGNEKKIVKDQGDDGTTAKKGIKQKEGKEKVKKEEL